jgi:hypothetical protein
MTDADEPASGTAQNTPVPAEVQADVREALQQVADLFGGGASGDHSIFEGLQGLSHLGDPDVRERLTAAMQALRTANVQGGQGGPMVMDLRGTEAGQALREMLQGVAGGTVVHTASSSQAQVFINGQEVDPKSFTPLATSSIIGVETPAAYPTVQASTAPDPQPSPAPPVRQASIVEDASGGGFFGWLSRLLNGR